MATPLNHDREYAMLLRQQQLAELMANKRVDFAKVTPRVVLDLKKKVAH